MSVPIYQFQDLTNLAVITANEGNFDNITFTNCLVSGVLTLSAISPYSVLMLDNMSNVVGYTMTNGQLILGSTGAEPVIGNLTTDANQTIKFTNGPGSLEIYVNPALEIQTLQLESLANATSTATGSMVTQGGVGIQKDLWANNLYSNSNITALGTTDSNSLTSGTMIIGGGIGISKTINCLGLKVWGTTDSTAPNNGSVQIVGGMGVAKTLYAETLQTNTDVQCPGIENQTGNLNITVPGGSEINIFPNTTGNIAMSFPDWLMGDVWNSNDFINGSVRGDFVWQPVSTLSTLWIGSGSSIYSSQSLNMTKIYSTAVSTSVTTGAFVVSGGIGCGGRIFTDNLTCLNPITASGMESSSGNITLIPANNNLNLFGYSSSAFSVNIGLEPSTYWTLGLAYNTNDYVNGSVNEDLVIEPASSTNTLWVGTGSSPFAQISKSSAVFYGNVNASSTTTGSLIVPNGGLGLGGNIYCGGSLNVFTGQVEIQSTAVSSSISTGALILTGGGMGMAGDLFIGSTLNVAGVAKLTNTADTSGSTTGALIVSGGCAINKKLTLGSDLNQTGNFTTSGVIKTVNSTNSSSAISGSIITNGGVGIAGNLFIGQVAAPSTVSVTGTTYLSNTLVIQGGGAQITGVLYPQTNIQFAQNTYYSPFSYYTDTVAFNITLIGPWSVAQTWNCTLMRIGKMVVFQYGTTPGLVASSSSYAVNSTANIPSDFRPSLQINYNGILIQNGSFNSGILQIFTGGNIAIYASPAAGNFTSGSYAAVYAGCTSWMVP